MRLSFIQKAKVLVFKDEKVIKTLDNKQYNSYRLKKGESFNYGQFKSAKIFKETSTPIAKVIKRAKRIIHFATRKGSKVIIVTARQDMDDKKFSKKLLKHKVLISVEFMSSGLEISERKQQVRIK